jgi:hypothetical protein
VARRGDVDAQATCEAVQVHGEAVRRERQALHVLDELRARDDRAGAGAGHGRARVHHAP